MNLDWDNIWQGLALLAVAALAVFVGELFISTKVVDDYYLSRGGETATCVYAHWTWHTDEKAFCTNDVQQAIDVISKLKGSLKGK